jgi:hypothetical protein
VKNPLAIDRPRPPEKHGPLRGPAGRQIRWDWPPAARAGDGCALITPDAPRLRATTAPAKTSSMVAASFV